MFSNYSNDIILSENEKDTDSDGESQISAFQTETQPTTASGQHENDTTLDPNADDESHNSNDGQKDENNNVTDEKTSSKRKRRAPENWKKNIRKKKRNSGEQYVTARGETKAAKTFTDFSCFCPLKCSETEPVESRKKCFDTFYSSGSWEIQTMYIAGHVKSQEVYRRYGKGSPSKSRRQNTRYYYLDNTDGRPRRVCKTMFLKTLSIDSARVHRALLKAESGNLIDQRGRHTAWNKREESDTEYVKEHITSFPTYKSHYSRKDTEKDYLSPDLNLSLMYRLYKTKCEEEERNPVSQSSYNDIFYKNYNYSFKPPSKDTCKTCDMLHTQIKAEREKPETSKNIEKLRADEEKHEKHIAESNKARQTLQSDQTDPKADQSKVTITFDLQKTLPTPKLTTGIAYYKRQLWVYNLGIHVFQNEDDKAYMFMWHEGLASRGAQEVSSCLRYFVQRQMQTGVRHLTAWSDSCGGQNRNIKVCCMWMHLLSISDLETVNHKFLESGHSYLPCDSDFGDIEKYAKSHQLVYEPEEWYKIVRDARIKHPFNVVKMKIEDFVSTSELETAIVNRKKTEDNEKVEWLKMKHIQFRKSSPLVLYYKYSHSDENFKSVSLAPKRKSKSGEISSDPSLLNPKGRTITKEKMKDLKDLLPYIPPVHHKFYKSLKGDGRVVLDDICGNNIDYELEED